MKQVGKRITPPEPPSADALTAAQLDHIAEGMARLARERAPAEVDGCIASMHDCLDGPEQEAAPLSDPGVMERLRQDWAKRQAIYGEAFGADLWEKLK